MTMTVTDYLSQGNFSDVNGFVKCLNALKDHVISLEDKMPKTEILKKLNAIRGFVSESPLFSRIQKWPRGYQGDFETINHIIKSINLAPKNSFGYVVEDYFLNSEICKQHRNKVAYQSQLVWQTIKANRSAKIVSIGCGTSEDLKNTIDEIKNSSAEITLIDVDIDAIKFSLDQLAEIQDRLTFHHGNIYKIMRRLSAEFDLILIGGVFDYLNDKQIVAILKSLQTNLTERGKIFFTNIDKNNPYRIYMEYLADWTLIERTESELKNLIVSADWPENSFTIKKDTTNLTHLVELHKMI